MSILRNTFVVLMFVPAAAFACISDRDCPIASHCDRMPGQESGSCTGGMLPEGPYQHMNTDPANRAQPGGEGCVTDADCGYTGRCQRSTGDVRGVCLNGIGVNTGGGGVRIGIPH